MEAKNNRRKSQRQALDPPELGYLLTEDPGYKSGTTMIDPPVLFESIPRKALCPLLNSLTYRKIKAGDRFINQGDPGDFLYIVQDGACVAYVEKDQKTHTVGRMGKGDVVGEMALLTGQRPFPEDDFLALVNMHLDQDIPDPAAIRPDIPEALGQFVLKACARKTAQRYQTVDEVMEVLLPLAEEMGLTPNRPTQNKKSLTTLHLIYQDEQRLALKQLLEDFSAKARKIGVELKTAEFPEI
jgi:CRP-like cAMP-binding protein